jgi:hypothetical protein
MTICVPRGKLSESGPLMPPRTIGSSTDVTIARNPARGAAAQRPMCTA